MTHYQQSLTIHAPIATIYEALTTTAGLRGWWTRDCEVGAAVGESIELRFERTFKSLRIERLEPQCEVRWRCIHAHIASAHLAQRDEWAGTQILFHLAPTADGHTRLDFEHLGLVPALECYGACQNGWRHFLDSLQQYAETGCGTPFEAAAAA